MTVSIGYKLSSEEQTPSDLVRYAQMAEDTGFAFALISDHFHPWIDAQGNSRVSDTRPRGSGVKEQGCVAACGTSPPGRDLPCEPAVC